MNERTLRIGLILLSIALMVGPIIAAFAAKGWDLQATVMGDLGPLENLTSGELESGKFEAENLEIIEITGSLIRLGMPVNFTNPLSFSITVENVPVDVFRASDNYKLGQGWLQQKKVVLPESPGSVYIIMVVTDGSLVGALLSLVGTVQLDAYGLIITVPFEASVPFPTTIEVFP